MLRRMVPTLIGISVAGFVGVGAGLQIVLRLSGAS